MRYLVCDTLLDTPTGILWKSVDEGWVRFDPSAAGTLLLTPIARFVLDRLTQASSSGLTEEALVQAVLQEEPDADPDDARTLVAAAIAALQNTRLIRARPLESQ